MIYKRAIENKIIEKIKKTNKAIVIYGARQVGKTTLVKMILEQLPYKKLIIDADQLKYVEVLSSRDLKKIKNLVSGYELLFIDEAQRIPEIGINLKIIIDNLPQIKLIITGSSSLDLAGKIQEPLTGRVWVYQLFPLSFFELKNYYNPFELNEMLEERLVFGSYPEIFKWTNYNDKKEYLDLLVSSYLFKDVFSMVARGQIFKLKNLLQLLAFQIGHQVSLSELANQLEMSKDTVARYINILEKCFIIFRLKGFSRNLRKEVTKMDKIYFYDLGIRNVLINNLNSLDLRNDKGELFENFLISERQKFLKYKGELNQSYFWRVYTGAEIDYIEEKQGKLFGYEFKWQKKKIKKPFTFLNTYKNSKFKIITKDNYLGFIGVNQ